MQQFARHTLKTMVVTTVAAVALGACSRDERQEVRTEAKQATNTAANVVDNAAMTTKVKAAFLADDMVKGTQINVDSNNGVVSLTGTVDSAAHKTRAEELAKGVSGVTSVQNNLAASANAAPGLVPGTQPAGTSPAATPAPNNMTPPATPPPSSSVTTPPSSAMSTPPTAAATAPSGMSSMPAMARDSSSMGTDMIKQVQQGLSDRGFSPGPIDGIMGPSTRAALRNFKQKEGMSGSDLDQATLKALGVSTT